MTGGYTRVPLRRDERWTGARMQQGRVLLDHDWNLNLDASARANQETVRDAIGWAGVVAGSTAFEIGVAPGGTLDLTVGAGRMWVEGLAAFAPAPFTYLSQELIAALPATGTVLAYLDVFRGACAAGGGPCRARRPGARHGRHHWPDARRLPRARRTDHRDDLHGGVGRARDGAGVDREGDCHPRSRSARSRPVLSAGRPACTGA